MKIVDDDPPIKTGAASKAYRDNWDRVFGERYRCSECSDTGCVIDPDADPSTVQTEGDMLKDCPQCSGDTDVIEVVLTQPIVNATFTIPPEAQVGPIEEPHAEQLKQCDGFYDDGIGPTACENREGCGRPGCPSSDFGVTE